MKPRFYITATITCLLLVCHSHLCTAQSWIWGRGNTGVQSTGYTVATDSAGNIFCGGINEVLGAATFGTITLPYTAGTAGYTQAIWARYNAAGTAIWAAGTQNGNAILKSVAVDKSGNLIVFGTFSTPTITIGGITLSNPAGITGPYAPATGYAKYFLAKYNNAGSLLWAVADGNTCFEGFTIGGGYAFGARSVTTDDSGNIYITSSFPKPSMTIGTHTLANSDPSGNTADIFIAKYSASGSVIWATSAGGNGNDYGIALTIASGDLYLTGGYYSTTLTFGSTTLSNPFGAPPYVANAAFLARYSLAGAPLWAMSGSTARFGSYGVDIAADATGNVYMSGTFEDTTISFGSTLVTRAYPPDFWSAYGHHALFLLKVSPANTLVWGKSVSAPGCDVFGFGISTGCDKVWVSGSYADTADIDGHKLPPIPLPWSPLPHQPAVFMAGYSLTGTLASSTSLDRDGGGTNRETALACDPDGNVYMCSGYVNEITIGPDDIATLGQHHLFIGKFGSAGPDTTYSTTDTSLCGTASITLAATTGYGSYLWDNASTLPSRTITTTGTFWSVCTGATTCRFQTHIDSFHVKIGTADTLHTSASSVFCQSAGPIVIKAPAGYTTWNWNTGDTSATITTDTSATYIVTATAGCNLITDTIRVTAYPAPPLAIVQHHNPCGGTRLVAGPATGPGYLWNTGSQADSITVLSAGTYVVSYTDTKGCTATDSINAIPDTTTHRFLQHITTSRTIEYGTSVQLYVSNGSLYTWMPNDGSLNNVNINDPVATPRQPTVYTVYAYDAYGCADSAKVQIDLTYNDIDIPNAFTPNGDGLNEVFRIINPGYITLNTMKIYNRWGEMIYSDNGTNKGWDGTWHGVPQAAGTYFYAIEVTRPDGKHTCYKNDLTLVR